MGAGSVSKTEFERLPRRWIAALCVANLCGCPLVPSTCSVSVTVALNLGSMRPDRMSKIKIANRIYHVETLQYILICVGSSSRDTYVFPGSTNICLYDEDVLLRAEPTCKDPFHLLNCNAPSLRSTPPSPRVPVGIFARDLSSREISHAPRSLPPSLVILTFRDRYGLLSGEGGRGTDDGEMTSLTGCPKFLKLFKRL